jgi:hypothetical protein
LLLNLDDFTATLKNSTILYRQFNQSCATLVGAMKISASNPVDALLRIQMPQEIPAPNSWTNVPD